MAGLPVPRTTGAATFRPYLKPGLVLTPYGDVMVWDNIRARLAARAAAAVE
jgi:hypothetical protein